MSLANKTKNSYVLCVGLMRGQKVMDVLIKTSANPPGVQTPDLCVQVKSLPMDITVSSERKVNKQH